MFDWRSSCLLSNALSLSWHVSRLCVCHLYWTHPLRQWDHLTVRVSLPDNPPLPTLASLCVQIYALKMISKGLVLRTKQLDHIMAEKEILFHINHPFIINIYGVSQDETYLYLALEYSIGGELFTHCKLFSHPPFLHNYN